MRIISQWNIRTNGRPFSTRQTDRDHRFRVRRGGRLSFLWIAFFGIVENPPLGEFGQEMNQIRPAAVIPFWHVASRDVITDQGTLPSIATLFRQDGPCSKNHHPSDFPGDNIEYQPPSFQCQDGAAMTPAEAPLWAYAAVERATALIPTVCVVFESAIWEPVPPNQTRLSLREFAEVHLRARGIRFFRYFHVSSLHF